MLNFYDLGRETIPFPCLLGEASLLQFLNVWLQENDGITGFYLVT